MDRDLSGRIGTHVTTTTMGESVRAYVPRPLPPDPPLDLLRLLGPIERANQALGRLDGMTSILPSTNLFVFMYVRKEALLSSQIEGTQSSLSDLLLFENEEIPFVPLDDVQEVSNYVAAMNHGLRRLADGFPLSAAHDRATLRSSPRRLTASWSALVASKAFFMTGKPIRCSSARLWRTSNSRPSTPSSTATAVSAGC